MIYPISFESNLNHEVTHFAIYPHLSSTHLGICCNHFGLFESENGCIFKLPVNLLDVE